MSSLARRDMLSTNLITAQMAEQSGLPGEILDRVADLGLGSDGYMHPGAVGTLIELAQQGKVEKSDDFDALMVLVQSKFPTDKLPKGALVEGGLFAKADYIWDINRSRQTRPFWQSAVAQALAQLATTSEQAV